MMVTAGLRCWLMSSAGSQGVHKAKHLDLKLHSRCWPAASDPSLPLPFPCAQAGPTTFNKGGFRGDRNKTA